ncbi:MAG: DUF1176 domain-containing protein [Rhizobiales bacterium]|nr:DUF1176 domain-containing protein [Hyphomicrobiales bacterium]
MLSTGTTLLMATLAANAAAFDAPNLPRSSIEAGLKKAACTLSPSEAKVVGTEWLGHHLQIVEVSCWRKGSDTGSILFAVPTDGMGRAELIMTEHWNGHRAVPGYTVASPGYDRKTRTLGSVREARAAGDCGTIKEWKWTGWFFQLIQVAHKKVCDGEPFSWDNSREWQVFPGRETMLPDEPILTR